MDKYLVYTHVKWVEVSHKILYRGFNSLVSVPQLINFDTDNFVHNNFHCYSALNGLSNHEGQILILENQEINGQNKVCKYKVRQSNEEIIKYVQFALENENWEVVYKQDNINSKFNKFLNIF